VRAVLSSPILAGARALVARSAAVEQVARLRRELDPAPVAVVDALDEDRLHREHWTANRPVRVRGAAAAWPAAAWTFAGLAERFGEVPVDVLVRDGAWWKADREAITRRIPFADLVAAALGPPGDGLYADGRTNLLDQPGLAPLRADLRSLPGLAGDGFPKAWVGPAGTVTPTHHDQSTGWFVQLVGRKRVHLASPLEPALAATAVGLYNTVDPRVRSTGDLGEVRWHAVLLEPGDALLIPVGWWHHVEALDPSISVSFGRFRWSNVFAWYCPGRPAG
jgi:hypothetical protein